MLRPDLKRKVEDQVKPPSKLRDFNEDQNVMVRNYFDGPKWLPGTILRKCGRMSYDVMVGSKIWRRHIDQIVETGLSPVTHDPPMVPDYVEATYVPPVENAPSVQVSEENKDKPNEEMNVNVQCSNDSQCVLKERRYPERNRKAPKRLIEEMNS